MSDRFELSFKNKVVRIWLIIMIPTVILQIFLILFTELPRVIPAGIPGLSWVSFFIWHYFYKRNQKNEHAGKLERY